MARWPSLSGWVRNEQYNRGRPNHVSAASIKIRKSYGLRFFLKLFFLFVFAVPVALGGMLFLAIDNYPAVDRAAEITPQNIGRAKSILDNNDPRKLKSGARRTISVSQGDLDLAVNYLAHRYARGSASVVLKDGAAEINASVQLPKNPIGRFVNVEAMFTENGTVPHFEHLRVGGIALPGWLADWLLHQVLARSLGEENYAAAINAVKTTTLNDRRVSVTYEWQSSLPDKLRTVFIPPADQERVRIYNQHLAEVSRSLRSKAISLAELIVPMFKFADERSRQGDPVAENRAAILALTFYVNGQPLAAILPAAEKWPPPAAHEVLLNRRDDFPKHFIISAALAAYAGTPLSDAVGVYKEIADSRGGSGFSFNDIAADRAGTRFGQWAAESPVSARNLQQRVAAGIVEREIMPATEDLPDFMPESEFRRRFGGVDAPAYRQMMAEIERRIVALPLYR